MKISHTLAATYLLVAATIVSAQVVPEQAQPVPETPATETATPSFTDEQVAGFAAASLQLREVRANDALDDAAKTAEARSIVAYHGLDPTTYNAIATAARSDAQLAERVRQAVTEMTATAPDE